MKKSEFELSPLIIKNPFEKEPLIPRRTIWSHSTKTLFQKCKRKFFWKKIMRLTPRREATPLVISNAMHEGLAKWYVGKKTSMKKIASTIAAETKKRIEENSSFYDQEDYDDLMILLNTLTGMLVGYSLVFAKDRQDWKFTKKDVEVWFLVNMGSFDYRGKADLLPLHKGKQLLVDHKAVKKIGSAYLEKLALDSQLRGYILGAVEDLRRPPKKVIYNLIKKCSLRQKSNETTEEFCVRIAKDYRGRQDFYFHRETLLFSKESIRAFEWDLHKINAEYEELINSSEDPLDPLEWPCADHVCDDFFRTCPYQPLCLQGLDKGTGKLYTQYNKKPKGKRG